MSRPVMTRDVAEKLVALAIVESGVTPAPGSPGAAILDRLGIALEPVEADLIAAALDAARRVAWCCAANVMGIPYRERREAMAQLRGALHALDGIEYQPSRTRPEFVADAS